MIHDTSEVLDMVKRHPLNGVDAPNKLTYF